MRKIVYLFLCVSLSLFSQSKKPLNNAKAEENIVTTETKNIIRQGNKQYKEGNYKNAERLYAQSVKQNATYDKSNYNLGNAYFQQKKFKEAKAQYELASKTSKDKFVKADAYHNIGNIEMQDKKYGPAVEAYKNSMRNNPNDDETRYNLALAQKLLKEQQDKENKDNKKDQDKDNKDNKDKNKDDKDNKDDKNKDNKDQDQKDKDQKDKDKENKDKKEDDKGKNDKNKDGKGDNDKKEDQKPKPQPSKLSPDQVQQLLKAMNNEENKTQQKMNARKERGKKVKQEKDW